jgi:hypothetical protein
VTSDELLPQALNTPTSNRLAAVLETIGKFIFDSPISVSFYSLNTFGGVLASPGSPSRAQADTAGML